MNKDYDIIIVGAGMVGATLACALGQQGFQIALIEAYKPDFDWPTDSADQRVSAITRASQNIFESIGVWESMIQQRVSPYREMRVWDATGSGAIHFDSADLGVPLLGHIVENRVTVFALHKQLETLKNVTLLMPATVTELNIESEKSQVTLDDGQTLTANLLVAADGSRSKVRELAGIETTGWPYHQHAVVAQITTSASHQETAWQRFMPDGPLAFLPLADGSSSIVWSTTPEHAEELLALDETDFLDQLQKTFGDSLGRMLKCGSRAAFPLRMQHAKTYTQPRLALLGDAAHTVHPLAGQGVNLGLADAASLAEVLVNARQQGQDIGLHKVLRRYERWRKGENLAMIATMDGFKRLFGSSQPALKWLRNIGLGLTNSTTPIKNLIMRQAMGLEGDLSRLAKGQSLNIEQ